MTQVNFVDLSKWGVTPPADGVRMVIAQPHLPTTVLTPHEPYRLTDDARSRQLEVLERTIQIASVSRDTEHTTHFTILPEYCIPGLTGVQLIEERLLSESWANGTVLIGGLDGVTRDEYADLLSHSRTHHDQHLNGVARVATDQWVNCSITWIKSSDGQLQRWVQPKLWPAWPEASGQNQSMFKGGSIFLFRGHRTNGEPFIFGTLVCFDWIAPTTPAPYERILEQTHHEAGHAQLPLTWLFVIQHNDKPSYYDFLNNVAGFFRNTSYPNATRTNTCIVFANTAGLGHPGYCTEYGSTSLILGPNTSFMTSGARPTLSHEGFRYRESNSDILKSARCIDVYFRERGECIHVLNQINPSSVQSGARGRRYAADNAEVHAAVDMEHILAPGAGVPVVVKWANDVLDQTSRQLPNHDPTHTEALQSAHDTVVERLRRIGSAPMTDVVRLATPGSKRNVEAWNSDESTSLRHILNTLRILGAGNRLESVGTDMVHGVISFGDVQIDVIAIQGTSHEVCIEHLDSHHLKRQRMHLLLVSRDAENTHWDPKRGNILRRRQGNPQAERKFTDPPTPSFHVAYQDVLDFLSKAEDLNDIQLRIRNSAGA